MTSFYQYHCEVSLVPTPQLCATTVILITSFIVIITTRVSLGSHLFCFHLFQLLLSKSTWICVNLDVYAILGHKCCIFFLWLKAMRLQITTNTSETNNLSVSQRRKIIKKRTKNKVKETNISRWLLKNAWSTRTNSCDGVCGASHEYCCAADTTSEQTNQLSLMHKEKHLAATSKVPQRVFWKLRGLRVSRQWVRFRSSHCELSYSKNKQTNLLYLRLIFVLFSGPPNVTLLFWRFVRWNVWR